MFSHFLILKFLVLFRIIVAYQNYTNTFSSYIEDQIDEAIKFVIVKNEIYCFGETYSYLIKQFKNEVLTKLHENKMKIKSYSSNILNINDEYFGVGGTDIRLFEIYFINGTLIYNYSLPKFSQMNYPSSLSFAKDNYIVYSYVTDSFSGKVIFFNYLNFKKREFDLDITWSSRYINLDCKFFYSAENILCIFSPDSNLLYYEIYSIFGRINQTQILYTHNNKNYIRTNFIILKDVNENINEINSEIIVASMDSYYTLNLFHFQTTLTRRKVFEIEKVNENELSLNYLNALIKITPKLFLVVGNSNNLFFFSNDLIYLGVSSNNSIGVNKFNDFFPFYKGGKKNLLITSTYNRAKEEIFSTFHEFEFAYCKDNYMNISLNERFNFTIDSLLESQDNNLTVYIKFPIIPNLEDSVFSFNYINNEDLININQNIYYNLKTEFSILINTEKKIKIGYVFLEALNETLMIPSELCYIYIN